MLRSFCFQHSAVNNSKPFPTLMQQGLKPFTRKPFSDFITCFINKSMFVSPVSNTELRRRFE